MAESSFKTLAQSVEESNYRALGSHYSGFHVNRFAGDYVVYFSHHVDNGEESGEDWLFAFNLTSIGIENDLATQEWRLNHDGSRIESAGERVIIIGSDSSAALGFSSWDFSTTLRNGHRSWLYRAFEADNRSHSFNSRLGPTLSYSRFQLL